MSAENLTALEYARNTFRESLRRDPAGPYAEHYERALAYVEHRIRQTTKGETYAASAAKMPMDARPGRTAHASVGRRSVRQSDR